MIRRGFFLLSLCGLAACEPGPIGTDTVDGPVPDLPPDVIAAADPRFVATARLRSDGCYWHLHRNVVETTFLPLRTPDGRPICALDRAERAARADAAAQATAGSEL